MEKTIATISTPLGKGAISIIRMTGDDCLKIASEVFFAKGLDYNKIEERKMILGNFDISENMKEKCLMVYFKNPNSYTGEDLIEFQIHGNVFLTQKILNKLIEKGCHLAMPGEFSKRAFLNGKLSLDEAESVVSVIESESESELKASLILAKGELFKEVEKIQKILTESLAKIEVSLDYPEEDLENDVKNEVFETIEKTETKINDILKNSENSRFIKNGVKVALVGKTNVGKSSVLNALLNEEKAIVTDIAGTTRDFVEGFYFFKDIKFNLTDTAGIRKSADVVEKIGVEKSKGIINETDITLFVYDATQSFENEDEEIFKINKNKNFINIINKCDKQRNIKKMQNEIEISALKNLNIDELKEKIYQTVIKNEIDFNKIILTNERHIRELKNCVKILKEIKESKRDMLEGLSFLVKKLWNCLGKITGNTENEDIIDLIFSKFCLGK